MTLGWTLPDPPNGAVAIPTSDTNAQAALFYGEDIYFAVEAGIAANYVVTPAGDWQGVSGELALTQSLLRRTITNPNEWRTKPKYGVGARAFLKAKDTPSTRAELEARIRSQYLLDPRVESVDAVTIAKTIESGVPVLRISVSITALGRLRTDKPTRVLITIR